MVVDRLDWPWVALVTGRAIWLAMLLGCETTIPSPDAASGGDIFTTRTPSMTTDSGTPCTPAAQRRDWPVKVVFVIEQSSAMCVLDPPGRTTAPGVCSNNYSSAVFPARVRAIVDFLDANTNKSNLEVALVPFGPLAMAPAGFRPASELFLRDAALDLPARLLGVSAGLAHALQQTSALIEADVQQTPESLRSRSRYVVVVISGGVPTPRCSSDDGAPTASALQPDGIWADTATPFCNTNQPEPLGPFVAGGDWNQNAQLVGATQSIVRLDAHYGLGDVRVHTRQIFNDAAFNVCGAACNTLFAPFSVDEARSIGRWTLERLSQHGLGTFETSAGQVIRLSTIDTSAFTTFCD